MVTAVTDGGSVRAETCSSLVTSIIVSFVGLICNSYITVHRVKILKLTCRTLDSLQQTQKATELPGLVSLCKLRPIECALVDCVVCDTSRAVLQM